MIVSKIIISVFLAICIMSCRAHADRNRDNIQSKNDWAQEQKQLQEEREMDIQYHLNNSD